MCQFKSAIVLKNRVFVPDYDSHSKMLNELHIEDDFAHASTQFVRVELSPPDGNKLSDIDGWVLKVDQDITPDWWDEKCDLPRIKAAIKDWRDARTFKDGAHEVKDGLWFAYGSAKVRATDSATVTATDSATVTAYGSATVTAYGSAKVRATDSATVTAYGSATVTAYGSATVTAYGSATVWATGSATVIVPEKWSDGVGVECKDAAVCVDRRNKTLYNKSGWKTE